MATTELVKADKGGIVTTFDEAARAAKAMALSGYFTDAKQASQAMVKILAGVEMGFGPFASMTGIHIIKGKPAVGANLMAAAVKAHPRYDYKIVTLTPQLCELEFYENGEVIGSSDFTIAEAKAAGVGTLKPPGKPGDMLSMHPRNMLFSRAMSNGVRWFTPDVFAGNAVYTPEELGGDVIEGAVVEVKPQMPSEDRDDRDPPPGLTPELEEMRNAHIDAVNQATADEPTTYAPDDSERPFDATDYPTDRWDSFRDYAVANLGHYTGGEHVANTLKGIIGADPWIDWTPEKADEYWQMLTERVAEPDSDVIPD